VELLIDREIAGAPAAFSTFGSVRLFDGRRLSSADLEGAEVLLVRSVSRVDEALLGGSKVRFVGTATAGVDHVDSDYLQAAGIRFADAAGCNARAVAEYVICCIYAFADEHAMCVNELTVGIVGYGHVGRTLKALLERLDIDFAINDPLLGPTVDGISTVSLDEALQRDVITLHVPLTLTGVHATSGLLGSRSISQLRTPSLLINAARGGVVDEQALGLRREAAPPIFAAIDCWSGEPGVAPTTVAQAWRATPHIAGHTLEARVNASAILHRQLCAYLGSAVIAPDLLPQKKIELDRGGAESTARILALANPLHAHTVRMRELVDLPPSERAHGFDELRRRYGLRRQFSSHVVAPAGLDADTVAELDALGFAFR
jgi:erythronate-4-phosphate dehydrogenase